MQNEQLLQDLRQNQYGQPMAEALQAQDITTYTALFAVLRDETAATDVRESACRATWLSKTIDKRQAVPPLLAALKSSDSAIRAEAAQALGMLRSQRARPPLIELMLDRTQAEMVRIMAVQALSSICAWRPMPIFRRMVFDPSEDINIRSMGIEWLSWSDEFPLQDFIQLLSDPSPDIRFWAAFRLAQPPVDIAAALTDLDRVAALDHTVPVYWGWHVDREALFALELAYARRLLVEGECDDSECYLPDCGLYLISPAPEYITFIQQRWQWKADPSHSTQPEPPITLQVDPDWLAKRLQSQWPDIQLNIRQPRPQAYTLDWKLTSGGQSLIGGLHRDNYAVVLLGKKETVQTFAAWYRTIIPVEQSLFLYEWADEALELEVGTTATSIDQAVAARDEKRKSILDSSVQHADEQDP